MQDDPEAIRREIERTQARMSDTVEALAYKTDVPARAKDALDDRVEAVKAAVSDTVASAGQTIDAAKAALPTGADANARVRSLAESARDNPIALVLTCLAIGAVSGFLSKKRG